MSAPEQVTITTWNCYRGPIDAKLRDLAYLNADIVALEECAEPEKQTPTFVWSGRSSIQGLALAVRPGLTVRALPLAKGAPHALMARVDSEVPEPRFGWKPPADRPRHPGPVGSHHSTTRLGGAGCLDGNSGLRTTPRSTSG